MQGFPPQIPIRRGATVHQVPHCLRSSGFGGDAINFTTWRRKRDEGALEALSPEKRGPKTIQAQPFGRGSRAAKKRKRASVKAPQAAELTIDVPKKYPQMLGITLESPQNKGNA